MSDVRALIADDEPLLRERLALQLSRLWPGLNVVAQARNGREAVELFDDHQPDVVFLDVHMPGMSGIEAARCMGQRADIVFVTAFDKYAVEAFRHGAIDYLVKPIEEDRLAETVQRVQQKLQQRAHLLSLAAPAQANHELGDILDRMARQMAQQMADRMGPRPRLKVIRASVGSAVRLVPVEQVAYLKSDTKYTLVVWQGGEVLIRKTIREMADELDPNQFVQIHRSAIVNLEQVSQFVHGPGDAGEVHLKGRTERLPVSRSYVHLFRQM